MNYLPEQSYQFDLLSVANFVFNDMFYFALQSYMPTDYFINGDKSIPGNVIQVQFQFLREAISSIVVLTCR